MSTSDPVFQPQPVELSALQAAWLVDHDIDFLWGKPIAQQFAATESAPATTPVTAQPAPETTPVTAQPAPAPITSQPAPAPTPQPVKTIAATLAPSASATAQAVLRVEGREGAPILILGMSAQSAQRLQKPFQSADERQLLANIAQHFGGSLAQDFSLVEIAGCVEGGKPLLERFNTCRDTLLETVQKLKPRAVIFGGSLLPNWCIPQLIAQPMHDLKKLRQSSFEWRIGDLTVHAQVSIPIHFMLGTTTARRQACLDWCRLQSYLRTHSTPTV